MRHTNAKGAIDWFFKDKHGKWAVVEWPNVLLWAWIFLSVVTMFVHDSAFRSHLNLLKNTVLFTWAYLEVTDGDSYFRRVLGAGVLLVALVGFFTITV